ncbi:hypothetical protein BGW38_001236 [Lunasporangiospora selenospora]|uniref:Histone deacetylase complex subunit SAP30 Sin3 binding domain-containing protein n=1 Tax=Lunasporangiospora selenospora TaxID=979761 RepID=A0A9P6KI25_9FUNG|nr:hypothetical protein BGW38_001236 [Lunasporangiospora selenospora]
MAPKQKSGESGASSGGKAGSSASANANDRHGNDRQSNAEAKGHGHQNGGGHGSERGSSSTGGAGIKAESGSGGSGSHHDKASTSASGSGAGTKRKAESPLISVELSSLDLSALRRYCRVNKLKSKSKSREDLVTAATKHWNSVHAKEIDSVAYFLFAVKHRHNVLKLTMPVS